MSNKLFFGVLGLALAALLGWMFYDSWATTSKLRTAASHHGLVTDSSGSTASIQYIFRIPDPLYRHDLSTAQIEQLSQSTGVGERYHVYGLTQADYATRTLYEVNWSKKWFKEEYRLWVDDLQVEFTYNTLNVYVSSAYPEGSCEYQATLDHENQHVEIHRRIFTEYQKTLQETLSRSPQLPLESHPVTVTSVEEGKKKVGEMISAALDPVFEGFKEALTAEQSKIDTPDSYNELKQRCQHW